MECLKNTISDCVSWSETTAAPSDWRHRRLFCKPISLDIMNSFIEVCQAVTYFIYQCLCSTVFRLRWKKSIGRLLMEHCTFMSHLQRCKNLKKKLSNLSVKCRFLHVYYLNQNSLTRNSNEMLLPIPRFEALRMNFKYQFVKVWLEVPEYLDTNLFEIWYGLFFHFI